jgi:hypothetical protein
MSYLAVLLLHYCNEYEAFMCFINLIHSYHFLSFYKGAMRQIEWRIVFFNDMFKKELPNLFQHFMGLDLSTEMFLLDWFLTMFAV